MTKRVKSQYDRILIGDGHERMYHYTWGQPLKYGTDFFTVGQKNARFAYLFYEQYGGYDGVDFNRIQNIIIRSGHAHTICLWAKNIPGANVRK